MNNYTIETVKETKLGTRFYITCEGSALILAEELGGKVLKNGKVSLVWGNEKELVKKINKVLNINPTEEKKVTPINLTEKEKTIIEVMVMECCFYECGFESSLWTWEVFDNTPYTKNETKGILGSLEKKKIINVREYCPDAGSTYFDFSEKGIEALKQVMGNKIDEEGYRIRKDYVKR